MNNGEKPQLEDKFNKNHFRRSAAAVKQNQDWCSEMKSYRGLSKYEGYHANRNNTDLKASNPKSLLQ
jgi:hypothetical protein